MDLNILWFILIATLFCVYFFLDGMDFGIGMLLPFYGKTEADVNRMIRAIGPTWGASEVWLLTAGGAMFASFPGWYATMFSGFYPALFLLLLFLIIRGICIEFRERVNSELSKKFFNWGLFIGSVLVPVLLAVALACLLRGVPIDADKQYTGTLFSLFSPFTLSAGVTALVYFLYHGAVVLSLKSEVDREKVKKVIDISGLLAIILCVVTFVFAKFETSVFEKPISTIAAVLTLIFMISSYLIAKKGMAKKLIILNGLVILSAIVTNFAGMFPNVMVSSTNPEYNLTVYNVASGSYTLTIITFLTLTLLPIVIGYTIWTHWIFSKKVDEDSEESGY